uniref:ArgoN domain-containing protein n=1 Tax=Caenorhabditis tropicalis TaxID=1561998 RepID=A0A1I7T9X7_9PELO
MSGPFDQIYDNMTTTSKSSTPASSSTPMGRIPKRDNTSSKIQEPSSKKNAPAFVMPNSTTPVGRDSFGNCGNMDIQLNMFSLDLTRMPERIDRLHVDLFIVGSNGKEFNLNLGNVAVSGDVNNHNRRLATLIMFRKFHEIVRHMFSGKSYHYLAYDSAAACYVPSGVYTAGEQQAKLTQDNFSEDEWEIVSKICRRKDDAFIIKVKPAGVVYSQGEAAMDPSNHLELTRVVEIVTSQKLNTTDFYQFGNATFPLRAPATAEPDATTEIRPGFAKVARIVEGRGGKIEMLMTIDTKSSPFFKECHVLKFVTNKYAESRGFGGGGGRGGFGGRGRGGGGRGGYGGRADSRDSRGGYYRDDSRDSRGSYGGRSDSRDSREGYRGDRRDSYSRDDRRDYRDDSRGRSDPYESRHGGDSARQFDPREVEEAQKALQDNRNLLNSIEFGLKGLYVIATHLKGTNSLIRITAVKENNAENTFFEKKDDKGVQQISVADYFRDTYNIKLKFPRLPLVVSKRMKYECFYPMEVLQIVPGQRMKIQKMSPNVQSAMTGRNAAMPRQHVEMVQNILRDSLKLDRNQYMEAFGIELTSTKPINLRAKLLPPAQIVFKNAVYMPTMSSPAFRTQAKFIDPARIRRVAVVSFDRALDDRTLEQFCDTLYHCCMDNGIKVESASNWSTREIASADNAAIKEEMERWMRKDVDILVGIHRDKKPDVHDVLKFYEESVGMQTIQLCRQTVDKMMSGQGGRQTTDNVMRKFNLKCGGTNFHLDIPSSVNGKSICANTETLKRKLFEGVQFIGFEISHGAARTLYDRSRGQMDGEPSIVGISYSLTNSTQLGGFSYMQTSREYKLQKLDEHFPMCVNMYNEHSKKLPSRIVIYRVGAGEGDFKRCKEEVEEIRATFDKIQAGYKPQLVVIIAQKTSHARVFPLRIEGNRPQEQNVPSGTCIDNVVTSFGYDEFILSSQVPLIGTVRPCKYTILVNEPGWSKNELIHLTYFRAFGHQVSYQPPSVPDVLYAAENLAKRGKNNYKVYQRYVSIQQIENRLIEEHADFVNEDMRDKLASAIVDDMSYAMNKMTIRKRNFWA